MVSLPDAPPRRAARQPGVHRGQRREGVATAELSDDATLGGYQRLHARPPAFGAADGRAYSVATFVDPEPQADGRYGAALLFVRWSGGERPEGHVETDYLAFGRTPDEAEAPLLALTLGEVKAHLDRCVERGR